MKKGKVLFLALLVLAAGLVMVGCAYEVKYVKDTPIEQRASVYLITAKSDETQIVKLDGKGIGISGTAREGQKYSFKLFGTYILGTTEPELGQQPRRIARSMYLTPGEHTITFSAKVLIGRKKFEGTFNFEAGKKYMVMLTTPASYRSMMDPGFSGILSDLGDHLKESLAGNYIIIVAEAKRDEPIYPDGRFNWVNISPSKAE